MTNSIAVECLKRNTGAEKEQENKGSFEENKKIRVIKHKKECEIDEDILCGEITEEESEKILEELTSSIEEEFSIEEDFINEASENENFEYLTMDEKNKFTENNPKLVHCIARQFMNSHIEYDDLVSMAYVGMAKGLNSFNKQKKTKLSTYVYRCMVNEVLYALRKDKNHSTDKNNERYKFVSFYQPLSKKDESYTLSDTLESEKNVEDDTINKISKEDLKKSMLKAIQALDEDEQQVILYRFGINNEKKTQKQLAEELNMSQANISKKEKTALAKLKRICITLKINQELH